MGGTLYHAGVPDKSPALLANLTEFKDRASSTRLSQLQKGPKRQIPTPLGSVGPAFHFRFVRKLTPLAENCLAVQRVSG